MNYKVKSKISHNGKEIEVGELVDLDEKTAALMPWALEKVESKKEPAKTGTEGDKK